MAFKFSEREKRAICIMVGCVCLSAIARFVVFPLADYSARLDKAFAVKSAVLQEMTALKAKYDDISRRNTVAESRFLKREKGFTLFSEMDQLAGKVGIKTHIDYMKPTTVENRNSSNKISQVEMKIRKVTLKQLVGYLQQVEAPEKNVSVKRLSIVGTDNPDGFINVVIQAETAEAGTP